MPLKTLIRILRGEEPVLEKHMPSEAIERAVVAYDVRITQLEDRVRNLELHLDHEQEEAGPDG